MKSDKVRLAFVIKRFREVMASGAERLCRQLAERLGDDFEIEVLTTTARDRNRWRDYYAPGCERAGRLTIRRFPIESFRRVCPFRRPARAPFRLPQSDGHERHWISRGPFCRELVEFIARKRDEFDLFVFFSYRYFPTYAGLSLVPGRSILIPLAQDDETIRLRCYRRIFASPRAMICASPEERELIERVTGGHAAPCEVIGPGVESPRGDSFESVRERFLLKQPYVLSMGRIDPQRGCPELLRDFLAYTAENPNSPLRMVLVGARAMGWPRHPRIQYLGYVDEPDKFGILQGCEAVVMPSRLESLSLTAFEALAMGKPVIANGECAMLAGLAERCGGVLPYWDPGEFGALLTVLLSSPQLREGISKSALAYAERNCQWDTIIERYREFLTRVRAKSLQAAAQPA